MVENIEIVYLAIGVLLVLNILIIIVALKCAVQVPDDYDLYNEDGDHIYYDRKLIQHKKRLKQKQ